MSYLPQNINHLVIQKKLSKDGFGALLGLNRGTVGTYINDNINPKLETLQKISEMFGYTIDDLLNKDLSLAEESTKLTTNNHGSGIPFYNIDVTASLTESFNDIKEEPEFYVDFKPFNDCSAYLPVVGDSMYPDIKSGEIVALKKVNNPDIIQYGEAHLVITNEEANNMRTLKVIRKHKTNKDLIILKPANPEFDEIEIPKTSILGLYIVKGTVNRKQF